MYEDKFRSRQGRDSKPEKKGQNGRDGSSYMYKTKKRVFDIIQIGNRKDFISSAFDIFIVVTIVLNLFVTLFQTFDIECTGAYHDSYFYGGICIAHLDGRFPVSEQAILESCTGLCVFAVWTD